jgi:hypothetical protein
MNTPKDELANCFDNFFDHYKPNSVNTSCLVSLDIWLRNWWDEGKWLWMERSSSNFFVFSTLKKIWSQSLGD